MAGLAEDHPPVVRRDAAGRGRGSGIAAELGVTPVFRPDPAGGQVVITRFECPSRLVLLRLVVLHLRIKRAVRRRLPELVGSRLIVDWGTRTLLSISVWPSLESVYGMGSVPEHVSGSRIPGRLGVRTTA